MSWRLCITLSSLSPPELHYQLAAADVASADAASPAKLAMLQVDYGWSRQGHSSKLPYRSLAAVSHFRESQPETPLKMRLPLQWDAVG